MTDKNETIKVKLARIEEKQDNLAAQLKTHLRHHWAATLALLGSTITFIFGIIFIIAKSIFV